MTSATSIACVACRLVNLSGVRLRYWAEGPARRSQVHVLGEWEESELLVEPVEQSVVLADTQQQARAENLVYLHFTGKGSCVWHASSTVPLLVAAINCMYPRSSIPSCSLHDCQQLEQSLCATTHLAVSREAAGTVESW